MKYTDFDLLCNEPFVLDGIGTIKCPTLKDIRKISFSVFQLYLGIVSNPVEKFINFLGLKEVYDGMSENEKQNLTVFRVLLSDTETLSKFISFFVCENIEFDNNTGCFKTYFIEDEEKNYVGVISDENFDELRFFIKKILGIGKTEEKEVKFKNNLAKKLFKKLNSNPQKSNTDENYSLDNMVKKYCTHNSVGINIINVWELTYYQFCAMFSEYCYGRQCDVNDMMAANSFSFKKSSDYNSMGYIKIINKQ